MTPRSVLVSGAGPAGLAVSILLARVGHRVTLIERAPALRVEGYAVDLRSEALGVATDLGVHDVLRDRSTGMGPTRVLDALGHTVGELPVERFSGDLEVPKPDLVEVLAATLPDSVEVRLDETLTSMTQSPNRVEVRFEQGAPTAYDVVVGADGVRSRTRRLAFGPDHCFVRDLGLAGVGFTTDNWLDLDHQGILRTGPGRATYVFSAKDSHRMTVSLTCATGPAGDVVDRVLAAFDDDGWETPRLLEAMGAATDLYTARSQQVLVAAWTAGRVTLLGDAACCAAPTSGMGTSQALVGARSLAAALGADDLTKALAEHEAALRPWIEVNQALGRAAAAEFGALPAT